MDVNESNLYLAKRPIKILGAIINFHHKRPHSRWCSLLVFPPVLRYDSISQYFLAKITKKKERYELSKIQKIHLPAEMLNFKCKLNFSRALYSYKYILEESTRTFSNLLFHSIQFINLFFIWRMGNFVEMTEIFLR